MAIVYHAFDTTNGKAYVGQTWEGLEKRRARHLNSKRRGPFQHALAKRSESFVWSVLFETDDQAELDAAELYWGEFFDCLRPNGYCLKLGMGRGRVSEETRQKMRKSQQNRTTETRRKLSESMKDNSNGSSNRGSKRTPEQKALIARKTSEAMKKWWNERA